MNRVLDTGCSYHMTYKKKWFETLRDVNGGSVRMGNKTTSKVRGVVTVRIKNEDGSMFLLTGVRYIRQMDQNLLSVGTMEEAKNVNFSVATHDTKDKLDYVQQKVNLRVEGATQYEVEMKDLGPKRKFLGLRSRGTKKMGSCGYLRKRCVEIFFDSQSAIALSNDNVYHERTKHVDSKYQKIREIIEKGLVKVTKISTLINPVDIFTKIVLVSKFRVAMNLQMVKSE
ncbi:hypothetical protein YC2023_110060 [Brassica napus]